MCHMKLSRNSLLTSITLMHSRFRHRLHAELIANKFFPGIPSLDDIVMETTPDGNGITIEWKATDDQPFDNFTLLYCAIDWKRNCVVNFIF
jgi:hypothetical protein